MRKVWTVIKISLFLAGVFLIILSDYQAHQHRLRLFPTQAELDAVLPGASIKDRKLSPIPHYPGKIQVGGKTKNAVALLSAELAEEVKGFSGPINILFAMDEEGRILSFRIISHQETPYYFRLIKGSGFFEKIVGRPYTELKDIKVVSGASVSSKAILDSLDSSAQLAGEKIFGKAREAIPRPSILSNYLKLKPIALTIILILGWISIYLPRKRWTRIFIFSLSIMVIGIWLRTPLALPHLFQIASWRVPFESNPYLVLVGAFAIISTIFSGPVWCAHLCPFAGLQELSAQLGKRKRWQVSPILLKMAREIRWLLLFILVVLYFYFRWQSSAELEPFFQLFSRSGSGSGIMLIIFTLGISFFIPRFWCRFFCPTGAVLLLLSSHRRFFKRMEQLIKQSEID